MVSCRISLPLFFFVVRLFSHTSDVFSSQKGTWHVNSGHRELVPRSAKGATFECLYHRCQIRAATLAGQACAASVSVFWKWSMASMEPNQITPVTPPLFKPLFNQPLEFSRCLAFPQLPLSRNSHYCLNPTSDGSIAHAS